MDKLDLILEKLDAMQKDIDELKAMKESLDEVREGVNTLLFGRTMWRLRSRFP